ncbi:MAG: pseudouridine synthase [Aquificaceae bacterium]
MEGRKVLVRLNRFLSMCGILSRRKADELIRAGMVKVNGISMTQLGYKIDPKEDVVEVKGMVIKPERKRYVLFNKPRFYLTSLGESFRGMKTIQSLMKDIPQRLYPAGRLDYNAEGLLILTNDGEVANRITHPKYKLPKTYMVLVEGRLEDREVYSMKKGATLEDGFLIPDSIKLIKRGKENTLLELVFHEGKKHIVKRFIKSFGYKVLRLKRVAIGPIRLGKLPPGGWRDMTDEEVKKLKRALRMFEEGNEGFWEKRYECRQGEDKTGC